jgi:hypothetical protein
VKWPRPRRRALRNLLRTTCFWQSACHAGDRIKQVLSTRCGFIAIRQ